MAKKEVLALASYSAPTAKVSGLSISRNGRTFTASWKVPSSATKDKLTKATKRRVTFWRTIAGRGSTLHLMAESVKSVSNTSASHAVDANMWSTDGITSIVVKVELLNSYGYGKSVKASYALSAPAAIAIGSPNVTEGDTANTVRCTFTAPDSSKTHSPRFNAKVKITKTGTVNKKKLTTKTWSSDRFTSEASGSYPFSFADSEAQSLKTEGDHIDYKFEATAYSPNGSKYSSRTFSLHRAKQASITSVNVNDNVVTIVTPAIDTATKKELEYGTSTSSVVNNWTKIGTVASGNSTSMSVAKSEIQSGIGEHVFFRIKTTYLGVDAYNSYSDQKECKPLFRQSGGNADKVDVLSDMFVHGTDYITAKVAWKTVADYDATELSWSADEDAWKSNKQPDSILMPDIDWHEGAVTGWNDSATVKISGLEEYTSYWFRARRYNTADPTIRSSWSPARSTSTGALDVGVVLNAPARAAVGEPLTVSWVVGGDSPQTHWEIKAGTPQIDPVTNKDVAEYFTAHGDDETNTFTIPAERVVGESMTVSVVARNGGVNALEDSVYVALLNRPSVTVEMPEAITALPFTATVTADTAATDVALMLVSNGATSNRPDGSAQQYDGDVVWSGTVRSNGASVDPETGEETDGAVQVSIDGAVLIDKARYHLIATPTANGLDGETVETAPIPVNWAHQAKPAEAEYRFDGDSEYIVDKSLVLSVKPSADFAQTDTFNVYRKTVHGVKLVKNGLKVSEEVIDRFFPFSYDGTAVGYVIETVTAEGDTDWTELEVPEAVYDALVIDWGGKRLELPYDISLTDSWTKSSESVTYLDGSTEGHWNDGAPMSQSISTNLLKIGDDQRREMVSDLGSYAGSAFVRTPAGHAYEANVVVSSVAYGASNSIVACGLTANEVDNGGFMLESPIPEGDEDA